MTASAQVRSPARTPEALHDILADAFNRRDLDAFVAAYDDDDALLVPPDGRSVQGRDDIRAATAPLLGLGLRMSSVVIKKLQTDGLALTFARWELVGTAADARGMQLSGSGTIVSRRRPDGTWRIVLDDPLSPHGEAGGDSPAS